jgi:hypothetical protein
MIDGDTQVYEVSKLVELPDEEVVVRRDFVVRILETDTPERRENYEGWTAATEFSRSFLFANEVGFAAIPRSVSLRLTGRKDVYGRWLGWALVGGVNLSYALNEAGHGEYRPVTTHMALLSVGEQ